MNESIPEKLRLIADCIEQGTSVQAKPVKPRIGLINWTEDNCRHSVYKAIELTDEVIKALEDAGIEL